MNYIGLAACVVGVISLVGCYSRGSSDTIRPLPAELVQNGYIAEINIGSVPADSPPDFKEKLFLALHLQVERCAKGKEPLRLVVSVSRFTASSDAKTILVGGSEVIKGSAQFIDPANGAILGDYDITHSVGGGNIIGAGGIGAISAMSMTNATDKMPKVFAEEVCDQVFGHTR